MGNKAVASGLILPSLFTFVFSLLNFVLLTTSSFTTLLNFFKSIGTVLNLSTFKLSTFVFKLNQTSWNINLNLLMSSLSTPAFKAIKSSRPNFSS